MDPKKARRGEAQIALENAGAQDPFDYLLSRYMKAKTTGTKDKWALELLPYVKPKLKAVDVTQTTNVKVQVTIGGDDYS